MLSLTTECVSNTIFWEKKNLNDARGLSVTDFGFKIDEVDDLKVYDCHLLGENTFYGKRTHSVVRGHIL